MNIPLIIVIIYLLALFGASIVSAKILSKKSTTGQGFLNANKGLNTIMVAAMIAGCAIGGSATVGVAQNAMGCGISSGMYTLAWTMAAAVLGLLFSTKSRHLDMVTLPDLFNKCFGGTAKLLMTVGQLVIILAIIALQYVAGGAILSAMLPEYFTNTTGMILTAVCFVGITTIGGMLGAGYSNIINMIVIYLGLVLGAIAALGQVGGMGELKLALLEANPDTPWFSPIAGIGLATVVGWIITMVTSVNGTQQNIQIALSGKSDKVSRNGLLLGALVILPVGFLAAIFGLVAAVKYPDINSASALPVVTMSLSPVVAGLLLSGLWAADISTGVSLLLAASNIITHDVIDPLRKSGKQSSVLANRVCILAVGAFTVFLALRVRSILGTIMTAQAICAGITIIYFMLLYKPTLCKKSSAAATMIAAYIVLALWLLFPQTHIMKELIYLEWIVCIIVFFIASAVDKRPITLPEYREAI